MSDPVTRLLERLGISFGDADTLAQALTHRSAAADHNERLEFLGDAVLELVVSEWLFARFADADEGELTRLRARLVRKETLADLARSVELGAAISLGGGELKSGGRHRDSILADAFEAVVGAYYLDAGLAECAAWLRSLLTPWLERSVAEPQSKDPKTRLQEWLQSRAQPLPRYEVMETRGAAHEQEFMVECRVAGVDEPIIGHGRSRRRAEQMAAAEALARLEAVAPGAR